MNNKNDSDDRFSFQEGCTPGGCASCPGGCVGRQMEETPRTMTLTMEDDTEVECAILTVFKSDEKDYIALLPLDENGQNQTGDVYLYRFTLTESGDPELSNIDTDEEYEKAAACFNEIAEQAFPD